MTGANQTKPSDTRVSDTRISEAKPSDFEENRAKTRKALPALLIIFVLGTLMIQAFNLVYQNIGDSLHMSASASLISTLPGIILGVVCMLYGTLCDFISPKHMTIFGVSALILGSLLGFFGSGNFWLILVARIIQVAGGQVAGSVFLVMSVKYLTDKEKAIYLGIYNAAYYLAAAIGVFAGGLLESIGYKWLLLIPALSVLFVPLLLKNTPDISMKGSRIDVLGILIFALIAAFIAIYFSYPSVWYIVAAVVLSLVFGFYVAKGKNPFLSKKFVTNKAYMSIILILFVYYFFNFACVPIYQVIGEGIYSISLTQVSFYLTFVYLVATVLGVVSGPIVNKLGRFNTMVLSSVLMIVGFGGSALCIKTSFVLLTFFACLFIAGITIVYTPIYDAASDALPVEENGRGIGICDLTMNTAASIGLAIYSSLMANRGFASHGWIMAGNAAINKTANMFWIMLAASIIALILVFVFRKNLEGKRVQG